MKSSKTKLVLITGAAQGLGKEIARVLSESTKFTIILTDINEKILTETANALDVAYYTCDVTDSAQVEALISVLIEQHGNIDVLINNAGIMLTGPFEDYEYAAIKRTIEVNTLGTMYCSRAVINHMKKNGSGVILNVVSTAGLAGRAERSVYNASKWAITGFTESLNLELSDAGISVLGIYPSLIDTNLFKNAGVEKDMKASMDPKEVASVIEFMLSFDKMQLTKVVLKDINHS